MIRTLFFAFALLFLSINAGIGQSDFPNTRSYDKSARSPKADLSAISWIAGHWKGEAFGGITEEIWSPPLGGSMMCVFKLVTEDKINFYEIVTITEEDNSLMLRLKHFGADLKGWEEKDETVDFKLVEVTSDKVYFDGFTFERVSEDEINIYVIIQRGDDQEEIKFNYKRVGD